MVQDIAVEYVYYAFPNVGSVDINNIVDVNTNDFGMITVKIAYSVGTVPGLSIYDEFALPASNFVGLVGVNYAIFYLTPQAFISWVQSNFGSNISSNPTLQTVYNLVTGPSVYPQYTSWLQAADAYLTLSGYYWVPYSTNLSSTYQIATGINPNPSSSFGSSQLYVLVLSVANAHSVQQTTTGTNTTQLTTSQAQSLATSGTQFASNQSQSLGNGTTVADNITNSISEDVQNFTNGISNAVTNTKNQISSDITTALWIGLGAVVVIGGIYVLTYHSELKEQLSPGKILNR
jgi:hypothetical protein